MTIAQRMRAVLAKLSVLSETRAASLEPRASQSAAESSVPEGVGLRVVDPDRPPPPDRSLYDFYAWQFERIDPDSEPMRAELAILFAERDYRARASRDGHRDALRSGALLGDNAAGAIAEEVQVRRVVEHYRGVRAIEVAVFEETTEVWVRKARQHMKCDPDTGYPRAPFLDWSEESRYEEVAKLRKRGYGQKRIAEQFGIAKSTVQRYWEPGTVAA